MELEVLEANSQIIKNESVLFSNHNEEVFFKRDEEENLISELKPITQRQRCENIFAYGGTGTGKTQLIKSVLKSIKDCNRSVICLYINCWNHRTSMAIYTKIADALGEPVSRRGRATDEIFDRILERMRTENIGILLALDDIEGLICRDDVAILHNLARVATNCARFGVIGISKDKNIINKLDSNILGALRFIEIEIKGYSKEQLVKLLELRAEMGLIEGSYDLPILEKIAEIGTENDGNGRLVLDILRRSAKTAEKKNKRSISLEDVDEATLRFRAKKATLNQEEQMIVDLLKLKDRTSSEIYWHFSEKFLRSKRQIQNYLRGLEAKGIIESRIFSNGLTFGSKIFKLKEGWQYE